MLQTERADFCRLRLSRERKASGLEQMLAIEAKLADRIVNVRKREMHRLLLETAAEIREPQLHENLERRHVEVAVMEKRRELGHVARQEPSILTDAVAADR